MDARQSLVGRYGRDRIKEGCPQALHRLCSPSQHVAGAGLFPRHTTLHFFCQVARGSSGIANRLEPSMGIQHPGPSSPICGITFGQRRQHLGHCTGKGMPHGWDRMGDATLLIQGIVCLGWQGSDGGSLVSLPPLHWASACRCLHPGHPGPHLEARQPSLPAASHAKSMLVHSIEK